MLKIRPKIGSRTTNHFYNADGSLAYKTDQKGQKIAYTYDSMQRVTMVQRYLTVNSANDEPLQRTEFEYDANSVVPTYSQNVSGGVRWGQPACFHV